MAGPFITVTLSPAVQAVLVALLATYAATQMMLQLQARPQRGLPGTAGMWGAGSLIGASTALTGGGGATLAIPFMLWCNVPMRTVIGTSNAIGIPLAAIGALGYALNGLTSEALPAWCCGYVYLPAVAGPVLGSALTVRIGAWISFRLSVPTLKRLVGFLLLVAVARMLIALI